MDPTMMRYYWTSPFVSGFASILELIGGILVIVVLFLAAAALLKYIQKK